MRNIETMQKECEEMAAALSIPYNHDAMRKVFEVYSQSFEHALVPVSIRSTTKDDPGMNIRYVDFWVRHNPYEMALENGFIKEDEHPIYKAYNEINEQYPIMGYGVDFEANVGFEKIWMFFAPHLLPDIHEITKTKSLPKSMVGNLDFFDHFGMKIFSAFGLDYYNKSSNIYFMNGNMGELSKERLTEIFHYLGFDVPSDKELEQCQKASTFYCTYSWESEKICFGILNDDISTVPVEMHPYFKKFADNAKFMTEYESYIYSMTYARRGN